MVRPSSTSGNDPSPVYTKIIEAIVTQKLEPSQKVSESVLTEMFGISRTTARNIMEQLTAHQFLVSVSPRVTRVAPLTLLDVKQNFAIRKMLKPSILTMGAPYVDYEEYMKLHKAINHDSSITDDETALRVLMANKEFNLYVVKKIDYPLLQNWMNQLEHTTMRIYWLYVKIMGTLPFSLSRQKELIEVMRRDLASEVSKREIDILSLCEERLLNAIFSSGQIDKQDLCIAR